MTPLRDPSNVMPQSVLEELVVRRGLSYADAVKEALRLATDAARPYLEAADALQNELSDPRSQR